MRPAGSVTLSLDDVRARLPFGGDDNTRSRGPHARDLEEEPRPQAELNHVTQSLEGTVGTRDCRSVAHTAAQRAARDEIL